MKTKRSICCAAVLLLVLGACGRKSERTAAPPPGPRAAAAPAAGAPSGTEIGQTMPAYSVKALDGSTFDIHQEKGKVVFLNVWATWCPPCRFEIPELQKLHDKYKARNFEVVGVSVDEGPAQDVRAFVADQKMTYPVAVDGEAKLANLLQTSVLPTSVILDRNGTIVWKHFGLVDTADPALTAVLEKALAQ